MLTPLEILAGFIAALMRIPGFRELAFQIAIEIMTRDDRDPAFKTAYLDLTAQLKLAKTADEKRPILAQLDKLKRGGRDA